MDPPSDSAGVRRHRSLAAGSACSSSTLRGSARRNPRRTLPRADSELNGSTQNCVAGAVSRSASASQRHRGCSTDLGHGPSPSLRLRGRALGQCHEARLEAFTHRAGAVASLRNIKNPSLVAKLVLERTDHLLLVGEGALRFALAHGFKAMDLLTEESRAAWLMLFGKCMAPATSIPSR